MEQGAKLRAICPAGRKAFSRRHENGLSANCQNIFPVLGKTDGCKVNGCCISREQFFQFGKNIAIPLFRIGIHKRHQIDLIKDPVRGDFIDMVFGALCGSAPKVEIIDPHIMRQVVSGISKVLNPAQKLSRTGAVHACKGFLIGRFKVSVNSVQITHGHDFNGYPHGKLAVIFLDMMADKGQVFVIIDSL